MGPTWAKIPIWDPHGSNVGIMPGFCPYGTHLPMLAGLFLTGNVHGLNIKFLIDTGATLSILHPDKYYEIPESHRPPLQPYPLKLCMGDGALRLTRGCAVIPIVFNLQKMVVADIDVAGVLGYDFLYENAVSINVRDGSLALNGNKLQCELESNLPSVFRVTLSETVTIPPNSELIVPAKVNNSSFNCDQAFVESSDFRLSEKGILVAKSLVCVHTWELPLLLANMSNDPQTIYSGTLAAKCEPVEIVSSDVGDLAQENVINDSTIISPKYGRLASESNGAGVIACSFTRPISRVQNRAIRGGGRGIPCITYEIFGRIL